MTERLRARLLLIAAAALAATLSHERARAQAASHEPSRERPPVAKKLDEFGRVGGCDHSARLDNFAIELQNTPAATGYVIAYGAKGDASGTAGFRLRVTKDYLVNTRGIDADRMVFVDGGPYSEKHESVSELWVVPPGAEAPKPAKYKNDSATFKGKFAEYEGWDGDIVEGDPGTGPPVGDTTLAGFAEVLRLQPTAVAYVVAYNGEDAAPGAWRRVAERDAENLKRRFGVEASRVKVLYGGGKKETLVRLWALPADEPPPVRADRKERRPTKAVKVVEAQHYFLKDAEYQQDTFKGFAEVLKADDQLSVCFVVRPELPGVREIDPESPPDPDETPDVDLVKLVESWKARLMKEYRVSQGRIIVMVVPVTEEWQSGHFEAWVVPPGAPLPDPSASEAEDGPGGGNE